LEGARVAAAELKLADLDGAHLERARLGEVSLEEMFLVVGVHLEKAGFVGRDLKRLGFRYTILKGVNLDGAHLKGAFLGGACLSEADLRGAHLEGALADGRTTWPEGFDHQAAGVHEVDRPPPRQRGWRGTWEQLQRWLESVGE